MDIEFSIPAIGHNPGSIGWLADMLDRTEVDVRESKYGLTCLYVKFPEDDDWTFLARPTTGPEDEYANHVTHEIIRRYDDVNLKVTPLNPTDPPNALFGQLTPAAEDAAKEWRKGILDAFVEQWRKDGEDEEPVTVTMH